MTQETRDYVTEKVHQLMEAPSCCKEAKEAAQAWLDAAGTEKETEAAKALITELEGDIMPLDGLIAFAGSEAGAAVFGDHAKDVAAHAEELKAAGETYCDCPACKAVAEILAEKDALLA